MGSQCSLLVDRPFPVLTGNLHKSSGFLFVGFVCLFCLFFK